MSKQSGGNWYLTVRPFTDQLKNVDQNYGAEVFGIFPAQQY